MNLASVFQKVSTSNEADEQPDLCRQRPDTPFTTATSHRSSASHGFHPVSGKFPKCTCLDNRQTTLKNCGWVHPIHPGTGRSTQHF